MDITNTSCLIFRLFLIGEENYDTHRRIHYLPVKLLFTNTKDRESHIYCFNISSQTIDFNESCSICAVDENTYRLHNVENFRSFRGFFQT